MLQQFGVSTNEICQEAFLKVAVLSSPKKVTNIIPFVEQTVHSLLSAESQQK